LTPNVSRKHLVLTGASDRPLVTPILLTVMGVL
jgi:hypothetical protein